MKLWFWWFIQGLFYWSMVYGIYNLVAFVLYFPMPTYRKNICGLWKDICLELAIYTVQKFSLVEFSSKSLKKLLGLNKEKKKEIVWLLEKCIGNTGIFWLCIPLLLVQLKIFLLCLGVEVFAVWYELLLYCVKKVWTIKEYYRENSCSFSCYAGSILWRKEMSQII